VQISHRGQPLTIRTFVRSMKTVKAVLGCLIAVLAAPAIAITGTNWVDDNPHPFVGLIVFYDDEGAFAGRCSGSLISPPCS
jgi:hypothetical protein